MKSERNTRAMVEAALVGLIVAVLLLTIGYIPLVESLMTLIPAIFSVVWIRHGRHYGMLSVAVAGILSFILGSLPLTLFVFTYGGLIGGFMGEGIRHKWKSSQVVLLGTIGAVLSSIIMLYVGQLLTGIGFMEVLKQSIDQSRTIFNAMNLDAQSMTSLESQLEYLEFSLQNFLPFLLIMSGIVVAMVNHWCIYTGLRRIRYNISPPGRFRDFELPRNVFLGSMLMMALSWVTGKMGLINGDILFMNIMLLVTLVFSIQGFSVAVYYMYRYKFPRAAVVALVVGIILFFTLFEFPLFILGMLETIVGIRARMTKGA